MWWRVARVAIAAAVMGGALVGYDLLRPHAAIESHAVLGVWILGACAIGGAVFVVACRALRVDELGDLWAALRRRKRR